MPIHFSASPAFGLCFAALLALQAAPAPAADSDGSGIFVEGKEHAVTFKDVYAFRAEDSFDKTKQVTLVFLSESPLDKKAMTATLRKERDKDAIRKYLGKAYARLTIDHDGKLGHFYLFSPPGNNLNMSGVGKSDVKVNTAKRVEGRFSYDGTSVRGEPRKIDLRFATDLADIGPPAKN